MEILDYKNFLLLIPLYSIVKKFLRIQTTQYTITDRRIIFQKGIFSVTNDEVELYRIKDIVLQLPFFLRIFSLGDILIVASERIRGASLLNAVPYPRQLKEELRRLVEAIRDKKGVREIDHW